MLWTAWGASVALASGAMPKWPPQCSRKRRAHFRLRCSAAVPTGGGRTGSGNRWRSSSAFSSMRSRWALTVGTDERAHRISKRHYDEKGGSELEQLPKRIELLFFNLSQPFVPSEVAHFRPRLVGRKPSSGFDLAGAGAQRPIASKSTRPPTLPHHSLNTSQSGSIKSTLSCGLCTLP